MPGILGNSILVDKYFVSDSQIDIDVLVQGSRFERFEFSGFC